MSKKEYDDQIEELQKRVPVKSQARREQYTRIEQTILAGYKQQYTTATLDQFHDDVSLMGLVL